MNEIRMYVERLFQGKVLSDDVIELKEEIYGNLVARYEDYVASGIPEDEALSKTKASITSIDDVLDDATPDTVSDAAVQPGGAEGEHAASSPADDAPVPNEIPAPSEGVSAAQEAAIPAESAETGAHAGSGAPVASDAPVGASGGDPSAPVEADAAASSQAAGVDSRKKWLPYAIGAAIVLCVLVVGGVVYGLAAGSVDQQRSESTVERSADTDANEAKASDSAAANTDSERQSSEWQGSESRGGDDAIVVASDGTVRYDNEPADELLEAVVYSECSVVEPYVPLSLSDTATIGRLMSDLPMGEWAAVSESSQANGSLTLAYEAVPEVYDGDSVDAALVYNAAALMCASSDLDTLQVSVTDSEDVRERDRGDRFVFTRQMMEQQFGRALTSDLVSQDGWITLKDDTLYTSNFIERTIDMAEDERW